MLAAVKLAVGSYKYDRDPSCVAPDYGPNPQPRFPPAAKPHPILGQQPVTYPAGHTLLKPISPNLLTVPVPPGRQQPQADPDDYRGRTHPKRHPCLSGLHLGIAR
jgi:hypothetical protein